MSPFTACIVQTTSLPYDKQGNLDRALRAMEAAAARGASLILFPEMFLTGYLIRDQLAQLAEPYPNGPALTVLGQKAKALSLGVVMGMPLANPGRGHDRPGRYPRRVPGQNPLLWRGGEDVRARHQPQGL